MIRFETTGMVTAIPRSSPSTTEFLRDYHERNQGTVGVRKEWVEPPRHGANSKGRYTTIRIATEGEHGQTCDLWINDYEVGHATFEKLLSLEVGDRVRFRGYVHHHNSYFQVRPTQAWFFKL